MAVPRVPRAALIQALGPGLLVACAAIGGSHLVWSTRAGALYGWELLGLLLLVNLLKYPFFLYGQKYTAATGESLLAGYRRQGMAYVWIFLLINVLTGVINIAGVSMLSAALALGFGLQGISLPALTVAIMAGCAALILLGHYRLLDTAAKAVIATLTISTLAALALAITRGPVAPPDFAAPSPWTLASFGFLIMFMGWMPAPLDLSAWSSLWMFSREKQTGHFATVREASVDFHLGYAVAVGMAVVFLGLGALVMHGSGEIFSASGIGFARQLVALYSTNIGAWSYGLILFAAFITMLSTSLTCVDGYPRALAASTTLVLPAAQPHFQALQRFWIAVSVLGAAVIVLSFVDSLLQLLGFAAVVSFVTSPILAIINFRVMRGANVPPAHRPGPVLGALSWAGILFFFAMTAAFVFIQLTRAA